MSAHGRPKGRKRHPSRTPPPHVIAQRRDWQEYVARTTPEDRARQASLLQGKGPRAIRRELVAGGQVPLFEMTLGGEPVAAAFGDLTCCFCDGDVAESGVETFDGRFRCSAPDCHAAEDRARERAGA